MPVEDNLSQLLESPEIGLGVSEKNIYYSRPATVFAAVAASIFTIVGVLGKILSLLNHGNNFMHGFPAPMHCNVNLCKSKR